ncbi:MAG: alanine racemase [Spirochaetales bacterium]|nr:alanine racemase [Spirochaetales bacterium]
MRATRAEIRLDNLRHNIRLIRERVGTEVQISMAVKADAYGHGAVHVVKTAYEEGVHSFGVATVEEGVELRNVGTSVPIMLLGFPVPEEIPEAVAAYLTPYVGSLELVKLFEQEAKKQKKTINVHIKVDTGMGRIGCTPSSVPDLAEYITGSKFLTFEGLATHFPLSDIADPAFTIQQTDEMNNVIKKLKKKNLCPPVISAANSGAIINIPETYFTMVRPGIMAYGYYPSTGQPRELSLKPVMELKSKITFLKKISKGTSISYGHTWTAGKDTWIATLPVGYGDGYSRLLSNCGFINIGGKRFPVRGRVCMDQTLVEIGPHCTVKPYDDVVLFGDCESGPNAEEVAGLMNTIPYEVTCLITRRVPRIYKDS